VSDDLRALLAAVVADPADDAARLAYADCLQEHGHTPRAEFIRFQIDAERLHPDSNARAALEDKAHALLAEHWIDWWGEVCAAAGLPVPAPKPTGRLGRLARRVGLATPTGAPYEVSGFMIRPRSRQPIDCLVSATFRRGFPDAVEVLIPFMRYSIAQSTLALWRSASPLTTLTPGGQFPLIDGRHLDGVRVLRLFDYEPSFLRFLLQPSRLVGLEDLTLFSSEYCDGEGIVNEFADQVAEEVGWLQTKRLTRLSLQAWTDGAAAAVANAPHLACLTALEVDILPDSSDDRAGGGRRLAILARSPHLTGLRELTVRGSLDVVGIEAAIRNPTWKRLRKLELDLQFWYHHPDPLAGADDLPELEELRLWGVRYGAVLARLARSPLMKRLRHVALRGQYEDPLVTDSLADAVDMDRIETFAIGIWGMPPHVVELLRAKFGDRLRLLT